MLVMGANSHGIFAKKRKRNIYFKFKLCSFWFYYLMYGVAKLNYRTLNHVRFKSRVLVSYSHNQVPICLYVMCNSRYSSISVLTRVQLPETKAVFIHFHHIHSFNDAIIPCLLRVEMALSICHIAVQCNVLEATIPLRALLFITTERTALRAFSFIRLFEHARQVWHT